MSAGHVGPSDDRTNSSTFQIVLSESSSDGIVSTQKVMTETPMSPMMAAPTTRAAQLLEGSSISAPTFSRSVRRVFCRACSYSRRYSHLRMWNTVANSYAASGATADAVRWTVGESISFGVPVRTMNSHSPLLSASSSSTSSTKSSSETSMPNEEKKWVISSMESDPLRQGG